MNIRKCAGALILLSLAVATLLGQDEKRGPSTPEERERAVKVARAYEKDPLSKDLKPDQEWLLRLLIEVPDIHISICPDMMPGILGNKKNHGSELMLQSMFSQAAFQIENPDRADDEYARYLAGVEGMLNAYEVIRAKKKKVKIKALNRLIEMRDTGTLNDFVAETTLKCNMPSNE